MKVALLSPMSYPIAEPFVGGVEAFLFRLATALQRQGIEVVCYACEGSNIPGTEIRTCGISKETLVPQMTREKKDVGAVVKALKAFKNVQDDAAIASWKMFYDAYNDPSIDVIHNNSFSFIPLLLSTVSQKPVLHTLHIPPDDKEQFTKVLCACHAQNHQIQLVAGSQASAQAWQVFCPVHRVIYCRLDTSALPPSNVTHDGRLTFVGRMDPNKGVEDAIAVAVMLGKPLDIYGAPLPTMLNYFEDHVQPLLQKHSNITYHGLVEQKVLQEKLQRSQALLFPIKWNEPFGYVTIEAMTMGTPVIMYNRGAAQELITEGTNGFIVNPDSLQEMAAAVERTEQLDRVRCASYTREAFNIDISAAEYTEIYKSLLSERESRLVQSLQSIGV
jgi:UDP-glucose:tetrahydrobiopterin glucosyltransferase